VAFGDGIGMADRFAFFQSSKRGSAANVVASGGIWRRGDTLGVEETMSILPKVSFRITNQGFPNFRPGAGRAHARTVTG
jgi:hypothetical protein